MTWELYSSLIRQAARGGAYSVKLNLLGEPLLHPQVLKQVRLAHQAGLYVMMNTNAVLLDQDMSRGLLEAGIDDLFFSVDSGEKNLYERIRPGAGFDSVVKNIENFIRFKHVNGFSHVRTRASMVTDVGRPTTEPELSAYQALMNSLGVDEIGFGPVDDHLTDHAENNLAIGRSSFVCDQIYQRLFITWDGVLVPCCGHWERQYTIGSATEMDLHEAWANSRYHRLRRAHESGKFQAIPICRSCSVPYLYHRAGRLPFSIKPAQSSHD
jgi:radical SAM protein with 4Fe4S-binding SPASM domain